MLFVYWYGVVLPSMDGEVKITVKIDSRLREKGEGSVS